MKRYKFDTVILGAGPAGLAAGNAINDHNNKIRGTDKKKISFVIIDSGKSVKKRLRFNAIDIISGIGGAGLFSDGKFSFFPSATRLWMLLNKGFLKEAYLWYCRLLSHYKVTIPDHPFSISNKETKKEKTDTNKWFLKSYPSVYLSLDDRYHLIDALANSVGEENIITETDIVSCDESDGKYIVCAERFSQGEKIKIEIECNNIIVGGGRMWPIFNQIGLGKFMRLEYGVRIQDKPDREIFTSTKLKDPKYIFTSTMDKELDIDKDTKIKVEYRTFCCCRRGEIVETDCDGIKTLSGRSDCDSTNVSNIGFNVRILDRELGERIKEELCLAKTFKDISVKDAVQNDSLEKYYGELGNEYLKSGLKLIIEKFPDLEDALLSGPTLEGVGIYPDTDDNLKIENENIWVVGDACGKFRGITAATVSGYYVGRIITQ